MAALGALWVLAVFLAVRGLAARLLAVRIGPGGALLAAALAIAGGVGAHRTIGTGSARGPQPYLIFAVLSLLITMVVVTAAGLLSGPAVTPDRVMSGIPHPLRRARARVDRTRRYLALLWLGARYGLGPLTGLRRQRDHQHIGVALRNALQEAGGIFIKFGQLLSSRTDLLPAAIAVELSSLQDDVPGLSWATIRGVVEGELGRPLPQTFEHFDERPLAAASIAQVHRARLPTGDEVVVKVQRPAIERLVTRDLDILLRLADSLEARADWARRLGSVSLAEAFARNLSEELDFRIEARNMAALAGGTLRVPSVYREISGQRMLVEEWVDGRSLRSAREVLDRFDRTKLARRLFDGMLDHLLRIGVFHADPHAGNVLITATGELVLLDLGSVGHLDRAQRLALTQALAAMAMGRPAQLCDALLDLAGSAVDVDVNGLERALDRFLARLSIAGAESAAQSLNDLLGIIVQFGIGVDPQLAGVFRALATLDGTLRLVDPAFDVIGEARRYAAATHLGMPRPTDLGQDVVADVVELMPILRRLPHRIDRIAGALERGEFSMRLRTMSDARDVAVIGRYVNRIVLAFVSASIGLVSVLLLGIGGGPTIFGTRLNPLLGNLGLVGATVLGLRVVAAITRERG